MWCSRHALDAWQAWSARSRDAVDDTHHVDVERPAPVVDVVIPDLTLGRRNRCRRCCTARVSRHRRRAPRRAAPRPTRGRHVVATPSTSWPCSRSSAVVRSTSRVRRRRRQPSCPLWRASRSTSPTRRWRRPRRRSRGFRNVFRGDERPGGDWDAFALRSTTTSTRPPRSRSCTSWRDHELLVRGARGLRPRLARAATSRRRPRSSSSPSGGWRARGRRDFERGRPAAGRDRGRGLGDARRARRLLARPPAVSRDLVYGRRAVREALRGRRRGARALGDRAGAQPASRGSPRPRAEGRSPSAT